ncbi:MAG: sulfotransferase [Tepidisphaeraceae bacterium]
MIVGAQRSGTTWLQFLCAAHPKIAGSEELHLFSRYLGHVIGSYWTDLREYANADRPQGLPCVLSQEEFDDALRRFATTVFARILHCKPGATLAIEKTPDHVLHLHYIRHLFPNVKVIHVIRDPRDVVVSQLAAAASWGEAWAPHGVADAAQRWVEWVGKGRQCAGSDLYTEVRYETLLSDGPRELARVYDFLGLPLEMEEVDRIYAQFSLAALKAAAAPSVLIKRPNATSPMADGDAGSAGIDHHAPREAFYRKGQAGAWRESLSEEDVRTVERIAGPLMDELGYAHESTDPASTPAVTANH